MSNRPAAVHGLSFSPGGPVFGSPADWRDQFFYQLLIDRFDDNCLDTPPYDPARPSPPPEYRQGGLFQGGNLKGIARRLDYIRNLGCTALWISPPFKNRQDDAGSYHGYAIQDFLNIDPRFGTTEDLRQLVCQAHQRGIYVILDIVINHTGDVWSYVGGKGKPFNPKGRYEFGFWRQRHPESTFLGEDDAVWPVELQDPDCFTRRGAIRNFATCSDEEAIDGDFYSLKDLNLDKPQALDALIKVYKYWIAVADVDGYRIDTVRHVKCESAAIFCNALHEYARRIGKGNFLIFGEVVGDDCLLQRYVGHNTPPHGADQRYPLFDAVLDFQLYAILEEVLKGTKSCEQLRLRYEAFRQFYRDYGEASRYFITFVDNHDQPHRPWRRFLHGANDPRLGILAVGYLLSNMGIPCLYYGTEQGFDGGGNSDRYIRQCMFGGQWGAFGTTGMHFFNDRHPIYQGIAAIARVRAQQPALRYGRQYFRQISANGVDFCWPAAGNCTLAFSRVLDTHEVLVALNLDQTPRQDYIAVDGKLTSRGYNMVNLLNGSQVFPVQQQGGVPCVCVPLEGRQIAILKAR